MSIDLATPAWEACVGDLMPAWDCGPPPILDVIKLLRMLYCEETAAPAALVGLIISASVPPEALGSRLSD